MGFHNQPPDPNMPSDVNDTFLDDIGQYRFESGSIELDEIIVLCIINIIIEIFGNGLLVLMIINERSLMDTQKRTAINQIATNMNCLE